MNRPLGDVHLNLLIVNVTGVVVMPDVIVEIVTCTLVNVLDVSFTVIADMFEYVGFSCYEIV